MRIYIGVTVLWCIRNTVLNCTALLIELWHRLGTVHCRWIECGCSTTNFRMSHQLLFPSKSLCVKLIVNIIRNSLLKIFQNLRKLIFLLMICPSLEATIFSFLPGTQKKLHEKEQSININLMWTWYVIMMSYLHYVGTWFMSAKRKRFRLQLSWIPPIIATPPNLEHCTNSLRFWSIVLTGVLHALFNILNKNVILVGAHFHLEKQNN